MRIYESKSGATKKWLIRALIAGAVIVLAWQAGMRLEGLRLKSSLLDTNDSVTPIFVTSQQFTGKIGGVDNATEICQRSAEIATLGGTWKPLLGSHSENVVDKLQPLANKKFARFDRSATDLNSIVVADNLNELLQGNLKKTIDLNEFGQAVTNTVWTGFTQGGISTEHFCQEGISQAKGTVGLPTRTDWTAFDTGTARECNKRSSLYCYRASLASPENLRAPVQEITGIGNKPAKNDVALAVPSSLADLGISNLTINPSTPIGNVDARIFAKTFRRLDTSATPAPNAASGRSLKIMRTFEMTPNQDLRSSNPSGSFEFKITKRELDQLGLAPADVKVGKFHNGKWKKLTPVLASETDVPEKTYTFKVTFSEFSTFIISNDFVAHPICGDGIINQTTETCDDGNATDTDACTNACKNAICGDGIKQAGVDACDDGNTANNDGCSSTCKIEKCGDGIQQTGEQCEDGNTTNGDGCSSTCTLELRCGDGTVNQSSEQCDGTAGITDPNTICNAAGSLNECTIRNRTFCGDGTRQNTNERGIFGRTNVGDEDCDDGNLTDGDGCSANCTKEDASELFVLNIPFQQGSVDNLQFSQNATGSPGRFDNVTSYPTTTDCKKDVCATLSGASLKFTYVPPSPRRTISFWMKPTDNFLRTVVDNNGSEISDTTWRITINQHSKLQYTHYSKNNVCSKVYGQRVIEKDKWVHVATIFDGTKIKMYINGQFQGEDNISNPADEKSQFFQIGAGTFRQQDPECFWWQATSTRAPAGYLGKIDEFRYYNRVLVEREIKALAQICGDSEVQGTEQCDTGGDSQSCTAQCTKKEYCGDGIKNGTEQCDAGTSNGQPNTCTASCTLPTEISISGGALEPHVGKNFAPPALSQAAENGLQKIVIKTRNAIAATDATISIKAHDGLRAGLPLPSTVTAGSFPILQAYEITPSSVLAPEIEEATLHLVTTRAKLRALGIASNAKVVIAHYKNNAWTIITPMLPLPAEPATDNEPIPFIFVIQNFSDFVVTQNFPACGNKIVDTGEQCDDGNRDDLDACSNQCLKPVKTLVGHWKFDEGTGIEAKDASSNNYSGKFSGIELGYPSLWQPGKIGLATELGGSFFRIPAGSPSAPFTKLNELYHFTISLWFKQSQSTGEQVLLEKGNAIIALDANNRLTSFLGSFPGVQSCSSGFTVQKDTWYQVAMTYETLNRSSVLGSQLQWYVNGVAEGNPCALPAQTNGVMDIIIGANQALSKYFRGLVDDVQIHQGVLSAAEILQIYNSGNASVATALPPITGPSVYFPFDEGSGTVTTDIINRIPAELKNGALFENAQIGFGKAISFDGVNDTLNSHKFETLAPAMKAALNPGKEITMSFWMKGNPDMNTCCKGLVTTDFYGIEISPGLVPSTKTAIPGVNFFTSPDGGAVFLHSSDGYLGNYTGAYNTINDTNWHHVTGVLDGATLRLYTDGVLRLQSPSVGSLSAMSPLSFLSIGSEEGRIFDDVLGNPSGNRYFKGSLDEVKIFPRALSASEIKALSQCGNGVLNADTGEQCDGNAGIVAGSHTACNAQCKAVPISYCGDGIPQNPNQEGFSEQCDSGDRKQCTALCTLTPRIEKPIARSPLESAGATIQFRFEIKKKTNP